MNEWYTSLPDSTEPGSKWNLNLARRRKPERGSLTLYTSKKAIKSKAAKKGLDPTESLGRIKEESIILLSNLSWDIS